MGVHVPNKNKPEKCAMCPAYRLLTVPTFWADPDPFQKVEAHCVLLDKHIESINEVLEDCPLNEIVRCKDCKHNPWDFDQTDHTCIWDDDFADRPQTPDDFCSYGERANATQHTQRVEEEAVK